MEVKHTNKDYHERIRENLKKENSFYMRKFAQVSIKRY